MILPVFCHHCFLSTYWYFLRSFFFQLNLIYLFIYLWLCWVFAAACRVSLVASEGDFSLRCTGSHSVASGWGAWAPGWVGSVVMAHGLSCFVASQTRDRTHIPCIGRWILPLGQQWRPHHCSCSKVDGGCVSHLQLVHKCHQFYILSFPPWSQHLLVICNGWIIFPTGVYRVGITIPFLFKVFTVYDQPRQHVKKQRHYFANKGLSSQG